MRKWLFLLLLLTACVQPPSVPNEQSTQESADTPEMAARTYVRYPVTAPGLTISYPIASDIVDNLGPLDSTIQPNIRFFNLQNNVPTGQPIGNGLNPITHSAKYSASWYTGQYMNVFSDSQLVRMEFRSQHAPQNAPACTTQTFNVAAGCLGFVDFEVQKTSNPYPTLSLLAPINAGTPRQRKNIASALVTINFHISHPVENHAPTLLLRKTPVPLNDSREKLILTAEALDVEDGDISSNVTWHSNIDGNIGTGKRIAPSLTGGWHQITASVTDSVGKNKTVTTRVYKSSTLPTKPRYWMELVKPTDNPLATGGLSYYLRNADGEKAEFQARLSGYQAKTLIARPLYAKNAEFKLCFQDRGIIFGSTTNNNQLLSYNNQLLPYGFLQGSNYVFGITQNIIPMPIFGVIQDKVPATIRSNTATQRIESELHGPWAVVKVDHPNPATVNSSSSSVTINSPNTHSCYIIEKQNEAVNIYSVNSYWPSSLSGISKQNGTLLATYSLNFQEREFYQFFLGFDTTDETISYNSLGEFLVSAYGLPDDTTPVDPENDPNTETVEASVDLDIDLGSAQQEFTFDALVSRGTGLTYLWDFGDGKTSTDGFVYHAYDNPGEYTVKLTITNSVGRTNVIEKKVYVLPTIEQFIPALDKYRSIKFNPTNGRSSNASARNGGGPTVTFDLGELFEGFRYEVDFGDGSNRIIRRKGQNSTIVHSYPLGVYTYKVQVYDERPETTQRMYPESRAQQDATLLVEESTWFTLWSDAPKAKFTMSNPNDTTEISADGRSGKSDENGDFFGNIPLTIDFDATSTQPPSNNSATQLDYRWEFGDGSPAQEGPTAQVSHTFTQEGFYLITLTVTDKDTGLNDTYQAFVKAKAPAHDALITVVYPEAQLATASLFDYEGHFVVEDDDDIALQQATTIPVFRDHFPYVMVFNPSVNRDNIFFRVLQRHNPFFCDPVDNSYNYDKYYNVVFNNGSNNVPITNSYYSPTFKPYNIHQPGQGGLCVQWLNRRNKLNPFIRSTNNTLGIQTPRQDFRNEIDSVAGLRVPQVYVSVLPDSMIDGSLPSPNLIERRAPNPQTGKEELMLMVQIRQSDIDRSRRSLTFDVPAYGVDNEGRIVNANGYFHADIVGEQSDCGDCVMVNGRTTISLTVPLPTQNNPEATFNLNRIQVSRDGTCDFDQYSDLNMFLSKCITVTTSHEVPINAPSNIVAFKYPLTEAAISRTNRLVALTNLPNPLTALTDTADRLFKWFGDIDNVKDVLLFGVDMIPLIGDGKDILHQGYITYFTDQDGDLVIIVLASIGLTLDIATGGIADITALMKASYKVSIRIAKRGGGGAIAKLFKSQIDEMIAGLLTPKQMYDTLKVQFDVISKVGKACGLRGLVRCFKQMDITLTQSSDIHQLTAKQSYKQYDEALEQAEKSNIARQCFVGFAVNVVEIFPIEDILNYYLVPAIQGLSTQQSNVPSNTDGCYSKLATNTINQNIHLYQGIKREELRKLAPHHIVPLKENGDRCPQLPSTNTNVCAGARGILLRYNIDIARGGENGVMLPSITDLNDNVSSAFFQRYPCATVHTAKLKNPPRFHTPEYYEKVYTRLEEAEKRAGGNPVVAKQAIVAALSKISVDLLQGQFVRQNYSHANRGTNCNSRPINP